MKILLVGSDKVFAIEVLFVKYLRKIGIDVHHFTGQSTFYDYYQKNLFNKVMFRLGLSSIYKKINNAFKASVEKFNPDIIWIFKGMEITPESIQWAKSRGCKIVNYNPDNPLLFSGKGSGNKNVAESIGLFDLYLSYDWEVVKAIKEKFSIATDLLPFGFDISKEVMDSVINSAEINKVCFLGNPDKERAAFILALAKKGIEIDVYGNNWNTFIDHTGVQCFPAVYKADYWKTLYKYRVQLNLMRPHNPNSHNMRTFELGGIGGIQLAPDTIDHTTFFEPGKEIFVYKDADDCASNIFYLLSLSSEDASAIRTNARERSLYSQYDYEHRAMQAVSLFQQYFPLSRN